MGRGRKISYHMASDMGAEHQENEVDGLSGRTGRTGQTKVWKESASVISEFQEDEVGRKIKL